MYARTTVAHVQPNRFDEAIATVRDAFAPAAREQSGYAGFIMLADRSNHQVIGISLWQTEADVTRTGNASGYFQERMQGFSALLTEAPTTSTHEVVLHES